MNIQTLFSQHFPAEILLQEKADLEFYGKDSSKQFKACPSLIVLPRNVDEVKRVIQVCNQNKVALIPSGGRTGYSGGATAELGEVVLSLARMNHIKEINPFDQTMVCEAGVTTEAICVKAAEHGLFYPVDFASKGSSHIAGNVATNAGGIRVIRYGNTRDWVLGLKVITGAGEELTLNGSLYKNATGYDLRGMFIGSEGTLGVITEVTLKLTTAPKEATLALCALADARHSLEVLREVRQKLFTINVIEYFEKNAKELVVAHAGLTDPFSISHPAYALIEVETPAAADRERFCECLMKLVDSKVLADVVIAENQKQQQSLMALRERISETIGKKHVPHKNDISVPVSKIPEFLDSFRASLKKSFPEVECIIFGHVGDGNLHLNLLKPEAMSEKDFFKLCDDADLKTFEVVQKFGGSISAEHGVGLLKKPFLHFSRGAQEIALMKKIKAAFDPNGILNPGKIFD